MPSTEESKRPFLNLLSKPLAETGTSLRLQREKLVSFLRENSVIRADNESIVSNTGNALTWLLDTRVALLNPEMSLAISALFWDYLKKLYPFQLCCMELTGIPLMVGVQSYAMQCGFAINGVVIRKERKTTGRRRLIEGALNDLPIVFLDDIVNSGDSVDRAVRALAQTGRQIEHVVALVDFGTSWVGEQLIRNGIHLRSLIALEELGVSKSVRPSGSAIERQIFREIWKFCPDDYQTSDVVPKSTPALDESRVYFGADSGRFYALNRATGETEWIFQAGRSRSFVAPTSRVKGIRSSPIIEGNNIYFGAYDGVLYALDRHTGKLQWQFLQSDWIGSSPCSGRPFNHLYVGLEHSLPGSRGSLVALDLDSGERQWEFKIPGLVHSSPLFIEECGAVFVGSNNGLLYCLDAATGELKWSSSTKGEIKSRPCYDPARKIVIAGSFDKSVYAWSTATGDVAWKNSTEGAVYSEPLIENDRVYVSSTDKHLHILRAEDGETLGRFYAGAKLYSSPISCRNRIYFASTAGTVFEFDPQAMVAVGAHSIGEKITNPVVWDARSSRFIITTVEDHLFVLERK